jgi:hypothetical protein
MYNSKNLEEASKTEDFASAIEHPGKSNLHSHLL